MSGSMGMECVFESFEFEPPWDKAYHACCLETQPSTSLPTTTSASATAGNPENKTTVIPTPGETYHLRRSPFVTCGGFHSIFQILFAYSIELIQRGKNIGHCNSSGTDSKFSGRIMQSGE